jgi:hypothetical protein
VDLALAARLRERFASSPHVDIADADARASTTPRSPRQLVPSAASSPNREPVYGVGKPILMALIGRAAHGR